MAHPRDQISHAGSKARIEAAAGLGITSRGGGRQASNVCRALLVAVHSQCVAVLGEPRRGRLAAGVEGRLVVSALMQGRLLATRPV